MQTRFRDRYGASPLHLLAIASTFTVAAYALARSLELTSSPDRIVIWMGGSIIAHDLVLFPLYALAGAVLAGIVVPADRRDRVRIAALNHLRAPALLSGLLLLVWYPLVGGPADRGFTRLTGLSKEVYLERWVLLSLALFAGSAAIFALRLPRLRRAASPRSAGSARASRGSGSASSPPSR
jgi:uncharacterized membrane protein